VLVPEKNSTQGPLNKILEPLACSIPVFTTPKGMIGLSWLKPNRDICVFEENELVSAINRLIFHDDLMSETGRNGYMVVNQYYSKRANEQKLLDILNTIK